MAPRVILTREHVFSNEGGYTLIQIIVVFVIIGIVIVAFSYQGLGFSDDARANVASKFLTTNIPRAIVGFAQMSGVAGASDDAALKEAFIVRGAKPDTPWDEPWTATLIDAPSGSGKYVRIKYPFAGSRAAEAVADVRKRLDSPDYPLIANVQVIGANTLQVDYDPPAGLGN